MTKSREVFYKLLLIVIIWYYVAISKVFSIFLRKNSQSNRVLFLAAFFSENAGYHWRVKKWADILEEEGFEVKIFNTLDEHDFYSLKEKNLPLFLIRSLRKRFKQVIYSKNFDTVIVRRELLLFNDYGNLFLDKLLLKIHPDAILDFDDDISAAKNQPKEIRNFYARLLMENGDKFNASLEMYSRFIVVSNYLRKRVLNKNQSADVIVLPTCVDYDKFPAKKYDSNIPNRLGWIGGKHNHYLINEIIPTLNKLSTTFDFELFVISRGEAKWEAEFPINFVEWDLKNEVNQLLKLHIGLMPLTNTAITKGKGGFKLIQYMSLGIVSVASPITINQEIIDDGKNSFLANDKDAWFSILSRLLAGNCNLNELGSKARKDSLANYSFSANKDRFLEFMRNKRLSFEK